MTHPGHLTDYSAFYDKLMDEFEAMASVASDKLEQERLVHYDFPWSDDGPPNGEPIDKAREALSRFASNYCGGDYAALDSLKTFIKAARDTLNGPEIPNSVPDEVAAQAPLGIDSNIVEIGGGLDSWSNDTGKLFKHNFVTSIGQRKANNVSSLDTSINTIETAGKILIETRKAALQLPGDAKKQLESYYPLVGSALGAMDSAFSGIGIVTGPLASAALVVTQKALPGESGLTVAGLMSEFCSAITTTQQEKQEKEKWVADHLTEKTNEEGDSWGTRVCARPRTPADE